MNAKARTLGMTRSRFADPTGLSPDNVSTANDLAKMVRAAADYPLIREFSTTPSAFVEVDPAGRMLGFNNSNRLVASDGWEITLQKTGYIREAGRCLVMLANIASKPVVIVLLDSIGKYTRLGDAERVKHWIETGNEMPAAIKRAVVKSKSAATARQADGSGARNVPPDRGGQGASVGRCRASADAATAASSGRFRLNYTPGARGRTTGPDAARVKRAPRLQSFLEESMSNVSRWARLALAARYCCLRLRSRRRGRTSRCGWSRRSRPAGAPTRSRVRWPRSCRSSSASSSSSTIAPAPAERSARTRGEVGAGRLHVPRRRGAPHDRGQRVSKLPYDLERDLVPVTMVASVPSVVVVHPKVPINSIKELIAYAKANPGKLNFASAGNGTSHHLAGELFKVMTGTQINHVPYKGAGPAMQDLLGGQVDLMFDGMGTSAPQIRGSKLRPLAVTTAARSPAFPEIPTMEEAGVPNYR